jgi:hypothetical protein
MMIIGTELARSALDRFSSETVFPRDLLRYEIQDDGLCVLFTILADAMPNLDVLPALRRITAILRELMPVRDADYAWVVAIIRQGIVVESCFGGNSAIPDWDGEQFVDSYPEGNIQPFA